MISIRTLGGYAEIGKNCTAVKIGEEVILLDMGIHLDNFISFTEDKDERTISVEDMISVKALPDIRFLSDWKDKVVAIIPTHAHLDHFGAIPYLANEFSCKMIMAPYTNSVLQKLLEDKGVELRNKIEVVNLNERFKISENITLEFVNVTHSTPDSAMAVIHTSEGAIVYANDFKLDPRPTLGPKTNTQRLREIGEEGVKVLIMEALYSDIEGRSKSESEARDMLYDLITGLDLDGRGLIVSTFSSHIARIKSIVEVGKKVGRKVVFLGRSLSKYISAAEECDIIDFSDIEKRKYGNEIRKRLRSLEENKEDYLIVCTGHQGEADAVLSKMANGLFNFERGDIVVFSCTVIPTETNIENRENLEEQLRKVGVTIYKDVHSSGHGSSEDMKEVIEMLDPKHIIPAHADRKREEKIKEIVEDRDVIVCENGMELKF